MAKDISSVIVTQVVVDLTAAPLPKPAEDAADVIDLDLTYLEPALSSEKMVSEKSRSELGSSGAQVRHGVQSEGGGRLRPQESHLAALKHQAQKKQKISTNKSVISSGKKSDSYFKKTRRVAGAERTPSSMKGAERKKVHCTANDCLCGNRRADKRDL